MLQNQKVTEKDIEKVIENQRKSYRKLIEKVTENCSKKSPKKMNNLETMNFDTSLRRLTEWGITLQEAEEDRAATMAYLKSNCLCSKAQVILSLFLSLLSVSVSVYLSLSVCQVMLVRVCLSICLSVCLSLSLLWLTLKAIAFVQKLR